MADNVRDVLEGFLHSGPFKDATRVSYRRNNLRWLDWAASQEIDPFTASDGDFARYIKELRKRLSPSSVSQAITAVDRFYEWLVDRRYVTVNPAAKTDRTVIRQPSAATLTLDEIKAMWEACSTDEERALLGLLAVNGLERADILEAMVEDLRTIDGYTVLAFRGNRKSGYDRPYSVLSPELTAIILQHLNGRASGPLFLSRNDNAIDSSFVVRRINAVAGRAGVNRRLTMRQVSDSMRFVAISQRFSWVSVVRALREMRADRLSQFLSRISNPMSENAALRMSRLVIGGSHEILDLATEAEELLRESTAPPMVAAALAGAAMERHLRQMCRDRELAPEKEESASLTTYANILMTRKVISHGDVQVLAKVAAIRDLAAHGWSERVGADDATWMIDETRAFVLRWPE